MEKKRIDKGFVIALMYIVGAILLIIGFVVVRDIKDKNSSGYRAVWLNSDKNTVTDEESYFFGDRNVIYRYDFETGKTERFCEFDFDWNDFYINSITDRRFEFVIYKDYVFCVENNMQETSEYHKRKMHRYNYRTGEDEILLEDMPAIWGINICNGYLVYITYEKSNYYLYPAAGAAGEEPIDVESIFKERGDKTNPDIQTVTYEGIDIVGCFDSDTGEVNYISLREQESGKELLPRKGTLLLDDGRLLRFRGRGWDGTECYAQCADNSDLEEYEITCFRNEDIGNYPVFLSKYMIQEGDEIVCLLQVRSESADYYAQGEINWQDQSRGDILFKWNMETGESSILYETSNKNTRIIGYKNGNVYLLHNYWVLVQPLDGGKRKKLFKIPKRKEIYYFDWQGDYLIVTNIYRSNEVLAAYKIE